MTTDTANVIGSVASAATGHDEHHYDYEATKIGMWLFLFTELLLFGGMFILYAVKRHNFAVDFHNAAKDLDTTLGMINTIVLLTSSLTMALAITALQKGNRRLSLQFVALTLGFAFTFLVIKYFEWSHKIHLGVYPGGPSLTPEVRPAGELQFFGLYYAMTGLHGIHVIIGMIILTFMYIQIRNIPSKVVSFNADQIDKINLAELNLKDQSGGVAWQLDDLAGQVENVKLSIKFKADPKKIQPKDFASLEISGLYWHLVDIIWIFLFPLFYLIT